MRLAYARLLASYTAIKEVNLVSYSHKTPVKIEKTSHSSKRKSSHIWLLLLGNFETLGSKFRHETEGLLPSFATIKRSLFMFLNLDVDEHPLHVGMLVQCS